ncbi:sigma-70 family RNA polymerase sigma factor [Nesterenkonia sp. PF2B19]|uniref:sigma-70 family RNA polymerase sigma factor n=1 Tax=unclassified Nesterenkonia TaxID=2629769 RepID=UPI000872941C|nr:sigma-70 family RNA polymerase sigma factor [Nesterenkonia sp. PF2B19]OSM43577.1 RNA polymerase subunit sigma [Nesterenkonia sp. PF2B19]
MTNPERTRGGEGVNPPASLGGPDPCGELLVRTASGDAQAFEELFRGQGSVLLAVILRIVRSRALAEEILQDVFAEVWEDCSRFDPGRGSGRAWLITVSRRRAIDRVRSVSAQRERDTAHGEGQLRQESPDVQYEALENIESARAARAVQGLPEDQARAIALAYYHGMTHVEIADHLGVPLGTVKTRIRDGMRRLRTSLGVTDAH